MGVNDSKIVFYKSADYGKQDQPVLLPEFLRQMFHYGAKKPEPGRTGGAPPEASPKKQAKDRKHPYHGMSNNPTFAIVGGGIGGLTLAIALQRKGFDAAVYEHAPEIKPLGAGLGLAANAVKAFFEIGIGDEVLEAGQVIKMMRIKDTEGNVLTETDSVELSAKLGTINNFTIHRADLHNVLLGQLRPGTLHLNKACIDIKQQSNGVTLRFNDGTETQASYVVAADGIHSPIRKKLVPAATPRYAGYTCWRAVIDDVPAGFDFYETSETWGAGGRFGVVPLSKRRVYWFACINAPANDPRMRAFTIDDLRAHFSNFHNPIPELLARTQNDQLIWSDIIDIKPLTRFAFGNVVLMGDAAHATTPNMGQGACMAVEDAATLANCIEDYATPEEAFRMFEAKRIGRTTRIVNNSWTLGKAAQLQNPLLVALRNLAVRLTPPRVTEQQVRFLHDISF
jgi:2-polyprenyl-6-methoxyphenol hydroxylase-like FAD-dependent oxidoreductase